MPSIFLVHFFHMSSFSKDTFSLLILGTMKLVSTCFYFFVMVVMVVTGKYHPLNKVFYRLAFLNLSKHFKTKPMMEFSLSELKFKSQTPTAILKDGSIRVVFWQILQNFENIYFQELLWTAASVFLKETNKINFSFFSMFRFVESRYKYTE